jgi:hypothetical protein
MPSSTPRGAYLNDHLAGAVAALDLLEKMRSRHEDTEFGRALDALQHDIEGGSRRAPSDDLRRLMETEALCAGIEGKLAGWRALAAGSPSTSVSTSTS